MGSRGRDIRRAAGEGGHPPKVVGSGKGERASRVGEDKGTPHSHGRIPIAVLGSNQRQDHGRSLAAVGRATISTASRSLITRFDLLRSISPPRVKLSCKESDPSGPSRSIGQLWA